MWLNFSKNIVIYGGTNALKSLVPLIILPILTLHLTPAEFGELSLIDTLVLFLSPFVLINVNASISVEYFKLDRENLRKYISDCLLLTFIFYVASSITVWCLSDVISKLFLIEKLYLILLPTFCILRVSVIVALTIFQSSQQSLNFFYLSLLQTLIDISLTVLFVSILSYGLSGRLFSVYVGFFMASLISLFILGRQGYLCWPKLKFTRRILSFSLPLIPHVLSASLIALSGRLFISKYCSNEDVGLYSVAYQIASVMLLVSLSINQAWSPFLFGLLKKNDIKRAIIYSIYLFVIFAVMALIILSLKDVFYYVFVSKSFYNSMCFFPVLVCALFFQSVYFLISNFLFFEKKTKQLAIITTLGAILNLLLNYFLIDSYGVIGIAYSSVLTWFCFMSSVAIYTYRTYSNKKVVY